MIASTRYTRASRDAQANRTGRLGCALVILLISSTACDEPTAPSSPRVDWWYVSVGTPTRWDGRYLLVVGEQGWVHVTCFRHDVGTRCRASIRSSDSRVVSVISTSDNATLMGRAAGRADINVTVEGRTESVPVEVITEPLRVDILKVTLVRPDLWCPACEAFWEGDGKLARLVVPLKGSIALTVSADRDGKPAIVPKTIESSAASVDAAEGCRPEELDPNCDVHSDVWISGVALGSATVTARAHGASTSFVVEVVPAETPG